MMIIKFIGILILAYFVMHLPSIFKFIRTMWTGVSQIKKQMRDFQEQADYESSGNVKYKRSTQAKKKVIPEDEGEYIDFEEVNE